MRWRNSLFGKVCDAQLNQMTNVYSPNLGRWVSVVVILSLSRIEFQTYHSLLSTHTMLQRNLLSSVNTSSTATLFWTSCCRLGGQGLGVELVEEEVEELSLLVDEGRERARNLTTDLLLYLKYKFYKLQILWNMTERDSPGRAHENSIFSGRAKVDVFLQHQCCTSSCMSTGLKIKMNPMFKDIMLRYQLSKFHKMMEDKISEASHHPPCNPIWVFLSSWLLFPYSSLIPVLSIPPVCHGIGQDSRNAFPQFILPSSATQHFAAFVLLLTILCPTTIP